ncbi:DUF1365 domain-containing protein [Panacagrimonas sp.]|uniref:DUF1365 domain-containing protein n=1 Tax=Panacagrimonas sp. TaxID=2480088 RepID=UPI003B51C1EB
MYAARVSHRRLIAPLYRFVYRVFYLLLDVDRIDEAASALRLFSRNRFNLLAFHDRDFGDGSPGGLRGWAHTMLRAQGLEPPGGRIRLLCMPRVLGYAFNPISLWYCEHPDGSLRAVIAEVRNTFGEKHSYVLASGGQPFTYQQHVEKDKCFHVSPFFDLVGRYRFLLSEPGQRLRVVIRESRDGVPILDATLAGERQALTDATILRQVARMPWMTLKVAAGIHWEALKIWLRGARFHRKPPPPESEVT